jgi:hypothetical protein
MKNRTFYILLVVYLLVWVLYFFRAELSFIDAGVTPDTIDERSLTNEEYYRLENSIILRTQISNIFQYSSLVMAILTFVLLRLKKIDKRKLAVVTSVICSIIFAGLLLVKGIHFVPHAPIR